MPKPDPYTGKVRVSYKSSRELADATKHEARRVGVSQSSIIRQALGSYLALDEHGKMEVGPTDEH